MVWNLLRRLVACFEADPARETWPVSGTGPVMVTVAGRDLASVAFTASSPDMQAQAQAAATLPRQGKGRITIASSCRSAVEREAVTASLP
jgi:hypothetical protein